MEGFDRVHGSKGAITAEPALSYLGIHMVGQIGEEGLKDMEWLAENYKSAAAQS